MPDGIVRNGTATGLKVIADRATHKFAGPRNITMVNVDTLAGAVTAMQTRYASVTRAAIAAFHPDRSLLIATRTDTRPFSKSAAASGGFVVYSFAWATFE